MGRFASTKHRRIFLHAMLDVSNYERPCGNCGASVKDLTTHGLKECTKVGQKRKIFETTMKFYNAPNDLDMGNKSHVMREALVKRSLLKVVCEYLLLIWNWEE